MKTVEQFYFDCDLLPVCTKVNLYDAETRKRIFENWQDAKITEYDTRIVKWYRYNQKTNLLMIWC